MHEHGHRRLLKHLNSGRRFARLILDDRVGELGEALQPLAVGLKHLREGLLLREDALVGRGAVAAGDSVAHREGDLAHEELVLTHERALGQQDLERAAAEDVLLVALQHAPVQRELVVVRLKIAVAVEAVVEIRHAQ